MSIENLFSNNSSDMKSNEINRSVDYGLFSKSSQPRLEPIIDVITGAVLYKELLFPLAPVSVFSDTVQDFFNKSEQGGLVQWLDIAMLEYGIDQLVSDRQQDPIGINMSYLTINLSGDRVARRLSSLPAKIRSKLCIELTETIFHIVDFDSCVRFLHAMKDAGISIALDDYGTGFHENVPRVFDQIKPDIIKIDHSLIDGKDIKTYRKLESLVKLCEKHEITLIGERVNESNINILTDFNIRYGQGWGLESFVKSKSSRITYMDPDLIHTF